MGAGTTFTFNVTSPLYFSDGLPAAPSGKLAVPASGTTYIYFPTRKCAPGHLGSACDCFRQDDAPRQWISGCSIRTVPSSSRGTS